MTLIATIHGPHFVAISDILVSTEGSFLKGAPLFISPLHDLPFHTDTHAIVGATQKSILLDERNLIQWAGPVVVAEAVVKEVASEFYSKGGVDVLRVMSGMGLTEKEKNSCAFIYNRLESGSIAVQVVNCDLQQSEGFVAAYAGSGGWGFFDDLQFRRGDSHNPSQAFQLDWLGRVAASAAEELINGHNLQMRYGGWYEIISTVEGKFRKLPYSISLYLKTENELKFVAPVLACRYAGHDLVVVKLVMAEGGSVTAETYPLPDLLGRPPLAWGISDGNFIDGSHFHAAILYDPATGDVTVSVGLGEGHNGEFRALIEGDKIRFQTDVSLLNKIAGETTPMANMFRPSLEFD